MNNETKIFFSNKNNLKFCSENYTKKELNEFYNQVFESENADENATKLDLAKDINFKLNKGFLLVLSGNDNFSDYKYFEQITNHLLKNIKSPIKIISEENSQLSKMAKRYSENYKYLFNVMPYDLKTCPMLKKIEQNRKGGILFFWDEKDKKNKIILKKSEKMNLNIRELVLEINQQGKVSKELKYVD